ncbi:3-methyladenine DNA glycosylase [Chitinophagaceae bacterium IBVUCB1]|nr:3-methyladenine DNA glycosylase [Chitinophagaceae bacterium IBVUCB1]
MILPSSFYTREDVVQIAKELLGKVIVTKTDGITTSGIITETEAYAGIADKASHAYGGRRTNRTEVMYAKGGVAYVYLCYGIHHLFNVVTNVKDIPHAVLIRAIEPVKGIDTMQQRRNKQKLTPQLTAGPGTMSMALGIRTAHTGLPLNKGIITLHDDGIVIKDIVATPRIGIAYAQEDALLPYRFYIRDNKFVSR